jgi:DNA ligase (NAD+)
MKARILELEKEILAAKEAYYINDDPIITDDEFDSLEDELRLLDPNNRVLSLTGSDLKNKSAWACKPLTEVMGSLEKINSILEYKKWSAQHPGKQVVLNPKADGGSIQLTYLKGKLSSAITRGNGYEGFDLLNNVLKMKNVKAQIETTADVVVLKGEMLVTNKNFIELNKKSKANGDREYVNARNCIGVSRNKDGKYCEYLTILYYAASIRGKEVLPSDIKSVCKAYGLGNMSAQKMDADDIIKLYDQITNQRDYYGFLIDGLVIKVDEPVKFKGNKPTNQIALKFPAEKGKGIVKEISYQKGKTGRITPVVNLEKPVVLAGASISRASIGSWEIMRNKKIFPGAVVVISRANDVIPHIDEVTAYSPKDVTIQDIRNILNDQTIYENGAHLYSKAIDDNTIVFDIIHMFEVMEFKNIAKATIKAIVDHFKIKEAYEIFDVDLQKLLKVDGFGQSKIDNLARQIKEKTKIDLKTFIDCLNISNLGTSRIVEIVNHFNSRNLNDIYKLTENDFLQVTAFGNTMANTAFEGLKKRKQYAYELAKRLTIDNAVQVNLSDILKDMNFCITGKTAMKRSEFEKLIEKNGGKNTSVGKANYLITNDTDSGSSKNKFAEANNIPIISEKQFFSQFAVKIN